MRLIDGNALIAEMHNVILEDGEDRRVIYEVIERQPTIEGRKTGKWVDGQDMPEYPRIPYRIGEKYCSECRNEAIRDGDDEQQLTEFCPNCGAEMRGE